MNMSPHSRKRKSGQFDASDANSTPSMAGRRILTKTGSPGESPSKRRRIGVTMNQKQALIDNLQLEVTERARKLRAQYSLQAQGLRTRIEIRVNRIPMALRKLKMGDLLLKHLSAQPRQAVAPATEKAPPPVHGKDVYPSQAASRAVSSSKPAHAGPGRPPKRLSDNLIGGDKENQTLDESKKRPRFNYQAAVSARGAALSPASSNSRVHPRDREHGVPPATTLSPAKSFIARPVSPAKQAAATSLLTSMVEKARSTRVAATRKALVSSTSSAASGATRTRKTPTTARATTPSAARSAAAAPKTARRASGISESSEASTSTVVRKGRGRPAGTTAAAAAKKAAAVAQPTATTSTRKTVISSIRKGVVHATAKKTAASKAATSASTATAAATTRSGRVLRKRD